jgi:hypothetical protein
MTEDARTDWIRAGGRLTIYVCMNKLMTVSGRSARIGSCLQAQNLSCRHQNMNSRYLSSLFSDTNGKLFKETAETAGQVGSRSARVRMIGTRNVASFEAPDPLCYLYSGICCGS